ncbi:MAG: type IV secretory system conjugative DNA transfer family protein [Oscillospiraceae bacterium]|nr:type IV secretory system conjugative DNA transfer family protein [Oscillospiraceae bacterium]
MCCGRDKAMKLLAELDKKKGIGLVERVKQGQGRPTKLYVKRFTTRTAPPSPAPPPPDIFLPGSEVGKNHPQTSEKSTSRRRKKPRQEVEKTDLNHTKRSQLDFNHPDPSIPPQSSPGAAVGMDRYEQREEVKANIDFENLQNAHPYDDVESLLELMVDVLCSTAPTTRIIGNADSFIYLGGNEQSTHKYVSELLGKETIETRTSSQSKGRNGSYSQNFQQAGRELLTPDEVRMLDNRLSIILIRGEAPVIDAKFDLERHPNIKYTGDSGAAPYVHKAPCLYDAGDLDFTFTSLDDIEIIE